MKSEDYSQGDAFQAEKRTVFSTEWLPLCTEGQVAQPGDYLSATVGGWGVVGVRDGAGTVRVLRNACRHQNMQVVGTPSGNCETFRCRFHGWTYDLTGRFLTAPPPVAPKDPLSPDLHLASLATGIVSGVVFFSMAAPAALPSPVGPLPAYGGTLTIEIACNWKVCVEHLLAEHMPSADSTWIWPLLAVRRAGQVVLVEQVVPHTFLRTRLLTHFFGGPVDGHEPVAASIKQACEHLQVSRAEGVPASGGALVEDFHSRLIHAYASDVATT